MIWIFLNGKHPAMYIRSCKDERKALFEAILMIGDYFEFLKRIAKKSPEVVNFRLIRECTGIHKWLYQVCPGSQRWQRASLFLEYIDAGFLKLITRITGLNAEKNLIMRWDNAPHHREIETFPHHVHEGAEIKPSVEPSFAIILRKIGKDYKKY